MFVRTQNKLEFQLRELNAGLPDDTGREQLFYQGYMETNCPSPSSSNSLGNASFLTSRGLTGRWTTTSCKRKNCSYGKLRRFCKDGVAKSDIGDAQTAMPEKNGFIVGLAPRPLTRDDLPEFCVQVAFV
jgi:hypothetical protein